MIVIGASVVARVRPHERGDEAKQVRDERGLEVHLGAKERRDR